MTKKNSTSTIFDPQVSFFQSATRPAFKVPSAPVDRQFIHVTFANGPLFAIFKKICSGYWREQISAVKNHKDGYDKVKKNLPCFTPAGTFRIRCDWDMMDYSGIVHLDYDHNPKKGATIEDVEQLKARIAKSPYTLAAFVSPGSDGLKVFVRVDTGANDHVNQAFNSVRKVFDELAGIPSDPTARNLSRLCFVSHDPKIYINEGAEVFKVPAAKSKVTMVPDSSTLASSSDRVFTYLYNLTTKGKFQGETFPAGYSEGDRNNFLFLFACNANRHGIKKSVCLEYVKHVWVQNNEGFPVQELNRSVNSAYSHTAEYATFNLPKHTK
jgi:hypothetical protein